MKKTSTRGVLKEIHKVLSIAGEPLHYDEITRRVLEQGTWKTNGKTPAATINAQLAVDIKNKGAASAFRRVGRGIFALNPEQSPLPVKPPEKPAITPRRRSTTHATLSFTDAAQRVLEGSEGRPMHYKEITSAALNSNLIQTEGKTPEATMYAQLLTECKRRSRRGEQPRFLMLGQGMVGLVRWQSRGLTYQIEQANSKIRAELLDRIKGLSPTEFEELIGTLLGSIGFEEVEVTSRSKDGGIDVRGTLVVGDVIRTRLAVQVKRWKNNVQAPVVQQVRGSLGAHEQGLIITTSDFSRGARDEAERADTTPVGLMNGEQLVALLVEYELGVRQTTCRLLELGTGIASEGPSDE